MSAEVAYWNWDVSPKDAPMLSVSEERLAILKLLEEKMITADEAEKLISALEGDA